MVRPALLALLAFAAGAAGGISSSLMLSSARAQVAGEIVVPVPEHGIVFRASSGKALARVRSDVTGGIVEVLDAREQVAVRLRATPSGGAVELGSPRAASRPALLSIGATGDPGY